MTERFDLNFGSICRLVGQGGPKCIFDDNNGNDDDGDEYCDNEAWAKGKQICGDIGCCPRAKAEAERLSTAAEAAELQFAAAEARARQLEQQLEEQRPEAERLRGALAEKSA